jgi:hypothetical protein
MRGQRTGRQGTSTMRALTPRRPPAGEYPEGRSCRQGKTPPSSRSGWLPVRRRAAACRLRPPHALPVAGKRTPFSLRPLPRPNTQQTRMASRKCFGINPLRRFKALGDDPTTAQPLGRAVRGPRRAVGRGGVMIQQSESPKGFMPLGIIARILQVLGVGPLPVVRHPERPPLVRHPERPPPVKPDAGSVGRQAPGQRVPDGQ